MSFFHPQNFLWQIPTLKYYYHREGRGGGGGGEAGMQKKYEKTTVNIRNRCI